MNLNKVEYMGYLGPKGTFSHCAADIYRQEYGIKLKSCNSFIQLIEAVSQEKIDTAIMPVENSIEGTVGVVLDLLSSYTTVNIISELILPIKHQLLARSNTQLNKVTCVISHAQAIGQCRSWLNKNMPHAEIIETSSTAVAAKKVSKISENWAAIGTAMSKKIYNLVCLAENINDYLNNTTRFLIISTRHPVFNNRKNHKTTIEFTLLHEPGSLYEVLGEFAKRKVNLTRIESRPAKTELGQYRFFIDFIGHYDEQPIKKLLDTLNNKVSTLRILGSYPSAVYKV